MTYTPSPQQAAFYTWVREGSGSCVLEAVAGAGKTTTLISALSMMTGDVFFGAYNKAIAAELKARVPTDSVAKIDVSTMHAAGFRFWRRVAKNVTIDGDKCRKIFRSASDRNPQYKPLESAVLTLVSLAKQAGLGVLKTANNGAYADLIDHHDIECPEVVIDGAARRNGVDLVIALANRLMKESIALDYDVIDFDDMIFSPLYHNARVWEHDWVLIDEAQDTNATRRALALRMLKRGGRLVAVGDPHQAIYGFTGADHDALDLIAAAVNAVRMPLTITYRCPKAVVKVAQQWVSHITAADSAPEGSAIEGDITKLATFATPGDAVLCRFTAPLLTNVYAFIAAGIPAKVEGREIGNGLKALATRWKTGSLTTLQTYLDTYLETECAKLRAKEKESKAVALEDKVTCLTVIMKRAKEKDKKANVDSVLAEIDNLFGDNTKDCVMFSTIHKSKGREWNRVVWLFTGPSPWARKEWEQQQERNLCYVAVTRAKSELIIAQ
jgi:DNA helicase-2/ATP-dependent DNA helicase PcrA